MSHMAEYKKESRSTAAPVFEVAAVLAAVVGIAIAATPSPVPEVLAKQGVTAAPHIQNADLPLFSDPELEFLDAMDLETAPGVISPDATRLQLATRWCEELDGGQSPAVAHISVEIFTQEGAITPREAKLLPPVATTHLCPAHQSLVSTWENLK